MRGVLPSFSTPLAITRSNRPSLSRSPHSETNPEPASPAPLKAVTSSNLPPVFRNKRLAIGPLHPFRQR